MRRRLGIPLALLLAVLLATAAQAAPKPTPESYAALQKQIAAAKVKKATVSPSKHEVKVKLADGKTYVIPVTAAQQAPLVASLKAKAAKVHVDKKKKKSSHVRYRYIVLGLVVVIALAVGIFYLLRGRRGDRSGGPTMITPGPSAPPPSGEA
jgi:ATP-dependent Zn protease